MGHRDLAILTTLTRISVFHSIALREKAYRPELEARAVRPTRWT